MVTTQQTALQALQQLKFDYYRAKYPNIPEEEQVSLCLSAKAKKYKDGTANELTACILDYLKYLGGYAIRINSQGQYDPTTKKFRKGGTAKGTADIHAIYDGMHLSIEVKAGRDEQSKDQKEMQQKIQAAGGIYYLARTFSDFFDWFNSQIKKG